MVTRATGERDIAIKPPRGHGFGILGLHKTPRNPAISQIHSFGESPNFLCYPFAQPTDYPPVNKLSVEGNLMREGDKGIKVRGKERRGIKREG